MKGRLRLHLSRTPALLWYASFVAKPELDFVIETNLNTKYSSTIENIFSSHLQRLVTRKHTVPKFKVRYSPFFSLDAFKMSPPSGDFENFIDLNFVSAKLEIIAQRGRGFPIHHKGDHPASTCFVTFNFSPDDWPEILKKPKNVPATTQTSQLVQKEDVEEENAPVNDEFINISIGKSSNSPVCEDETESDLDEPSREPIAVQVGKESRRAKLTATYGKFKEMAKVGKERIEPVLRRRGRADTNNSTKSESGLSPRQTNVVDEHDGRASDSNVPGPSSGIRRKNNSTSTDSVEAKVREKELISIWNIISSQPEFYRTKYAPSINGNYQWRYEQINGDVKREHNFLHVAVWEKPHGIERPILMGYVSLPLNIIYAKAAQTLGKSFIRKVRLSPPDDFDFERMKINIGEVASNRGFRNEMAFGELTLKIKLSSKDDKVKEKSTASAQTDHIETQSFSSQIQSSSEVMSPGTVTSRGRNLIGNIKQKFWTDKTRKNELPICSTPEPVQRILTTGSRSTSATSLKIDNQNNTQSDTLECSESEEYFVPLSHAAIDNSPEIEIATVPDESDAHLVNATARHYPVLVAKTPLDSLAAVAKEEGSKLHRDLPGRERRDTIEQQISKIESEIDAEIGRKKKLESDLRSASPISIKQSVEKNLDKCKERLNALTMLSMSYQAGMTDADTPED